MDLLSIPKLIKSTTPNNVSWIQEVCEQPGGLPELLKHLDDIDVYSYGLNYTLFYTNMPITKETFDSLLRQRLVKGDILTIYTYLLKHNSDCAHFFINEHSDIRLTTDEALTLMNCISKRNGKAYFDTIDLLLDGTDNYIKLYYQVYDFPELREQVLNYMNKNIIRILDKTKTKEWLAVANSVPYKRPVIDDYFAEHIHDLINAFNVDYLYNLIVFLKDYPKTQALVKEYVNGHFIDVLRAFYCIRLDLKPEDLDEKDEFNIEYLYNIVKQVTEYEHVNFGDIQRGVDGGFSTIFFIGNKVFKLGSNRAVELMEDSPYIVKPLARAKLLTNHEDEAFFEVTEKVEALDADSITEEELYSFYKMLREKGIVWVDVRQDNMGRLLKENKLYWYEGTTYTSQSRGMLPCDDDTVLQAGDLVMLDNDHRYREDEVPSKYKELRFRKSSYYQEFERRYRKETRYLGFIKKAVNKS